MGEAVKIDEHLEDCPFCGNSVYLEKIPLWTGSHGLSLRVSLMNI